MTDINKFFDDASAQIDDLRAQLAGAGQTMQVMASRIDTVCAQTKKSIPVRDEGLESEFNDMSKRLFDLSNSSDEVWAEIRNTLRSLNKKEIAENYSLEVKGFNMKARMLTKIIDEFSTSFGRLLPTAKSSSLHLNIWMLENATLNLDKLASKILFMARELAKLTE